jgi:DNA adenine methylase
LEVGALNTPEPRHDEKAARVEPFLKWPGGKRLLSTALTRLAPREFGRYFEPFLGSGALFFAIRPERAVLADSNAELIECFEQVRDNCEGVIRELGNLRNSAPDYYRVRADTPANPTARAARFIYLVKLAFNGIYRVNRSSGRFNVPYGNHTQREVFHEEGLRAASHILRRSRMVSCDFSDAVRRASAGDLVYLDPPYTLAHTDNGFIRYNQRLFSWADQVRLAECAAQLADRGVHVIVSNAPHRSILRLYPGFRRVRLTRRSQIAANPAFRRSVTELVLTANL